MVKLSSRPYFCLKPYIIPRLASPIKNFAAEKFFRFASRMQYVRVSQKGKLKLETQRRLPVPDLLALPAKLLLFKTMTSVFILIFPSAGDPEPDYILRKAYGSLNYIIKVYRYSKATGTTPITGIKSPAMTFHFYGLSAHAIHCSVSVSIELSSSTNSKKKLICWSSRERTRLLCLTSLYKRWRNREITKRQAYTLRFCLTLNSALFFIFP